MLQNRAVKKLRKMVKSEDFFPFLPRHRDDAFYFSAL